MSPESKRMDESLKETDNGHFHSEINVRKSSDILIHENEHKTAPPTNSFVTPLLVSIQQISSRLLFMIVS